MLHSIPHNVLDASLPGPAPIDAKGSWWSLWPGRSGFPKMNGAFQCLCEPQFLGQFLSRVHWMFPFNSSIWEMIFPAQSSAMYFCFRLSHRSFRPSDFARPSDVALTCCAAT
jgi:hypothetical protein